MTQSKLDEKSPVNVRNSYKREKIKSNGNAIENAKNNLKA